MSEQTQRRLAAIVSVDVVGYSRLMGADEAGTLARMKAYRHELWNPTISKHGGRIVGTAGDSLLVEYSSAVSAVQSAVEVQEGMAAREAQRPDDKRMLLRVGVNIGEVVVDGDDIYGDGVNVAARLQSLAPPGGVCISGKVYEEIEGKVPVAFADVGAQQVKNIARPICVRQWEPGPPAIADQTRDSLERLRPSARPSIAVLPFDNLSGDPQQTYIGDGLTENIIASLSLLPSLLVIARNSTFAYKGTPVKIQQVAQELGARFILEGSVQCHGDQMRVTAQLVDSATGHHLWSERYDRKIEDLFAIQDDVTREIVVALQIQLTEGEQARPNHRSTHNLQAWGYAARGYSLYERYAKEDNVLARELLERAVALDPDYAWAWAILGWTHFADARFGYTANPDVSLRRATDIAAKAIALSDTLPTAHMLVAAIAWLNGDYDTALSGGYKAIALDPNYAAALAFLADIAFSVGNWDESIALVKSAIRLHPHHPARYLVPMARAYAMKGDHERAIAKAEEGLRRSDSDAVSGRFLCVLAFAHVEAGRIDAARARFAAAQRLYPRTARTAGQSWLLKDPAQRERYVAALRQAGLSA